mgnify:CR=1 FL=1
MAQTEMGMGEHTKDSKAEPIASRRRGRWVGAVLAVVFASTPFAPAVADAETTSLEIAERLAGRLLYPSHAADPHDPLYIPSPTPLLPH